MAIYYCSWATGDDTTGTGTAAAPWKTITKATTSRTAGDEVRVEKSPDPTALTGTTAWTLNGTTVTGTGTLFTSELVIGDFISAPDGQWYEVITIGSNTSATLYKKYPSATASGHASQKLGVTDTGAASSSSTQVQAVSSSGTSSAFLYISGGWDLSTETQTGQTYFRQKHGTFDNRYGYGLYLSNKKYTNISRLHFLRYNYGIYLRYDNYNNIINSPNCLSNGTYGISIDTRGSNNLINAPVCNSNNQSGIMLTGASCGNTFISSTTNSNGYWGVQLVQGSSLNTFISLTSISNNSHGLNISYSSKNTILGTLFTAYNTNASINATESGLDISNASINESVVSINTAFSNSHTSINNMGGYSYIYSDYATANSQNATAGGTGKEWKLAVTDANRSSVYPFYIPVAKVAVSAGSKVTVKLYFKKSGTGIAGAMRCRYGQITWSDAAQDIIVACPDNTSRNQVTLEFTPTEAGVVEIEAGAWYISSTSQTVIVDDIEITQA